MGTKTVADYKLESRAENNLWPVTDDHRKECVENALVDLNDENPKVRSAARDYLLAVDKANILKQVAEQRRIEAEHARKLQLLELAVKIGIVEDDGRAVGNSASVPSASRIG